MTISVFEFDGQQVRIVGTADEPQWVAADVCEVLGIKDPSDAVEPLKDYQKGKAIIPTLGGNQEMLTVTEPGLYALVFKSRKPEAEEFQRWVFQEVLPSIRKTGSYAVPTPVALPASIEDRISRLSKTVQQPPQPADLVRMDGWQTMREMLVETNHELLLEDGVFRVWLSRHLADTYREQYDEQPPIVQRANSASYCYPPEYRKLVRAYAHSWDMAA